MESERGSPHLFINKRYIRWQLYINQHRSAAAHAACTRMCCVFDASSQLSGVLTRCARPRRTLGHLRPERLQVVSSY